MAKDIKFIHARTFDKKDLRWAYTKQNGICPYCHKHFEENEMQGDHIRPWSKGGITERGNLQMLCAECNGKKSGYDTHFTPWDGSDYIAFDLAKWDSQYQASYMLACAGSHHRLVSEHLGDKILEIISSGRENDDLIVYK